jgi:hypothetical protein
MSFFISSSINVFDPVVWMLGVAALAFVAAVVVTVVKKVRNPGQEGPRTWRALGAGILTLVLSAFILAALVEWLNMGKSQIGSLVVAAGALGAAATVFNVVRG